MPVRTPGEVSISVSKRLVALLVPLLLSVTACGDDGSTTSAEADDPTASASSTQAADSGSAAAEGTLEGVTVTGDLEAEPEVEVAEPPYEVDETTVQVIEEGSADVVIEEGNRVEVEYVIVNGRTGKVVESSWDADAGTAAPTFEMVEGTLIPGLYKGLIGQAEGSRVAIAAAPVDAFGEQGQPDLGVEPGDTMIFVIDVVEVTEVEPALEMAQGTEQDAPAGLPVLETDAEGVPTGFTADSDTDPAPKELIAEPVIVGDGPKIEAGQTVTVHYLGQLYPDGEIFDQSWTRGETFDFQLGAGNVIQGWDQGLIGQTVGSRVILAIPPELAYGEAGSPPTIPKNAPLLFAVDILAAS
jgi:peptidylprolyl isomerase